MQDYDKLPTDILKEFRVSLLNSKKGIENLWSYSAIENDFRKKDLTVFQVEIIKIDKILESRGIK